MPLDSIKTQVKSDQALWRRIAKFSFDRKTGAPFAQSLSSRFTWSEDRATAAIEEYRKFCYLAATTRDALTPPLDVENVWRAHARYDDRNHEQFCTKVLQGAWDRVSLTGEAPELERANAHAEAAYEVTFGRRPPAAIWTGRGRLHLERINAVEIARHVTIGDKLAFAGTAGVIAGFLLLFFCLFAQNLNPVLTGSASVMLAGSFCALFGYSWHEKRAWRLRGSPPEDYEGG